MNIKQSTLSVVFLFVVALLFNVTGAIAQISNIDRIIAYDTSYKAYDFSAQLAFSDNKQVTRTAVLSSNIELDRNFRSKYVIIGQLINTTVYAGKKGILNKGTALIDYRDKNSRRLSPELYAKVQWNESWGLLLRSLAGSDAVLRVTREKNKNKIRLYTGVGLFYEREQWNWNAVAPDLKPADESTVHKERLRLSHFWKVSAKLSPVVDVNAVSYLLFPMTDQLSSPRWLMEFNTYIKTSDHFNIVLHWDNIYDPIPAVPISNFFYSYNIGIQAKF